MATPSRSEQSRTRITNAALAIVARQGVKGLTVAGLARSLRLTPTAIHRHYRSREALLDGVVDVICRRLQANLAIVSAEHDDAVARLRQLLDLHLTMIRDNQALPRMVYSEDMYRGRPARKARAFAALRSYMHGVTNIVRHGQQQGRVRPDVDAGTVSLLFLGLVQPPALLWHLSDGAFDVTRHMERAWRLFIETIEVT